MEDWAPEPMNDIERARQKRLSRYFQQQWEASIRAIGEDPAGFPPDPPNAEVARIQAKIWEAVQRHAESRKRPFWVRLWRKLRRL